MVFVGLEVKQNTVAARANAYREMGAALADIWWNTAQDPDRAVLTIRFMDDESAEFTPAEQAVLTSQSIGAFRLLETTWRQVQLGLLEPEVLEAFGWNAEGRAAFAIHTRQLWPRLAPLISPDFREYLEGKFGLK